MTPQERREHLSSALLARVSPTETDPARYYVLRQTYLRDPAYFHRHPKRLTTGTSGQLVGAGITPDMVTALAPWVFIAVDKALDIVLEKATESTMDKLGKKIVGMFRGKAKPSLDTRIDKFADEMTTKHGIPQETVERIMRELQELLAHEDGDDRGDRGAEHERD